MRRLVMLIAAFVAVAAAAFYFWSDGNGTSNEASYRLAKVERGEIIAVVTATGTINPITTVIVSSQLSGQVVEILADYNSNVSAGQVVARLNSDQIRAKLDAARADLEQMRANRQVNEAQIERVKADTDKARATQADMEAQIARNEALLADAERGFQRQSELKTKGFVAQAAYDTARAQRDVQQAALNSAKAQLASAKAQIVGLAADLKVAEANLAAVTAQVAQREATVRQIGVDLRNTEIKSPVSGVVVQRNVELGQTVAASLQAPTLFLIADDLHRMEIAANIDETDVGRIQAGQRASFTVNAYPGRTFDGVVKQVRLGSQTLQNVVIYTAIISINNPRLELLPGMTANLRVETDRRDNVLRIPNAALRWRPPSVLPDASPAAPAASPRGGRQGGDLQAFTERLKTELKLDKDQQAELEAGLADMRKTMMAGGADQDAAGRRERARAARQDLLNRLATVLRPEQRQELEELRKRLAQEARNSQQARIFVLRDGSPQGVTIRIGATDGAVTEIVSGPLAEGGEVIVAGGPRANTATPQRGPRFGL